jgi:Copper transport outer membrane protein, MctB
MFDLRYHVASLAAVFLALILGILVGVGIDRGGFVSKAERKVLNDRIAEAESRRDAAAKRANELEEEQRATREYVTDTYPLLVKNRLAGKRIVLVSVGAMDARVRSSVVRALADAGASPPLRVRSVKVPIDDTALDASLEGRPSLAQYVGSDRVTDLGQALGEELVLGGKTPLWDLLSTQLVEERIGGGRAPADGVVVMRSVDPQQGQTARFLDGLYSGVAGAGEPAVGVETSTAAPSAVPAFERAALSTVDSVDKLSGRLALVLLLAGGEPGHYGLRRTATDGALPPIQTLPAPSG